MAATSVLWSAGVAYAQAPPPAPAPAPAQSDSSSHKERSKAAEIVSQPARDIGVSKSEIPPPLAMASKAPYSLQGIRTCRQLAGAVEELNQVLGPDFQPGGAYRENRMAKLAEAGGKSVINSLIPFRSLVREVTGAAPAERSLRAAINAGFARRGFLRGVQTTRRCRTAF